MHLLLATLTGALKDKFLSETFDLALQLLNILKVRA